MIKKKSKNTIGSNEEVSCFSLGIFCAIFAFVRFDWKVCFEVYIFLAINYNCILHLTFVFWWCPLIRDLHLPMQV
jgi:hypothetical protein